MGEFNINENVKNTAALQTWLDFDAERSCPLCNSRQWNIVSRRMQHNLNASTVICKNCSLVFTNPLPFREIYESFYLNAYSDYYSNISAKPNGMNREYEPPRIRYKLDRIESVRPLAGASLLEAGPGHGLFLRWAQRRGASVLGVEPSKTFYQSLEAQGFTCLNQSFERIQPPDGKLFDIIVINHVLEHFYDPNDALVRCRKLLKKDGLLIVEVPNILKPFRSLDRYFLRYVHTVNFSPWTLQKMLEKNGFEVKFKDESGNNWHSPEHLFVIAYKADSVPGTFSLPGQTADEVLQHLRIYRRRWYFWTGPAWYMRSIYMHGHRAAFHALSHFKQIITNN